AKILFLSEHAKFTREYPRELIERTMRTFYTRFFRNQFKRSCVPDGPKVGTVSLSPRGDWRMPSDADPAERLSWANPCAAARSGRSDRAALLGGKDQAVNNSLTLDRGAGRGTPGLAAGVPFGAVLPTPPPA